MSEEKTNKKKIMIIDDDVFLLDMYMTKFQSSGYEVSAFVSVQEALNALRDGSLKSEIIVLDLLMPEFDGWWMLETLRNEKLAPESVLIILSNQGEDEDIKRADDLGVDGYIVKSMTVPSEVVKKVEDIYKSAKGK